MKFGHPFIALILSVISLSSYADIFRWTDANGTIHFSDTKPENNSFESVKEQPAQVLNNPERPATKSHHGNTTLSKIKAPKQAEKEKPDPSVCADINIELDTLKRTEAVFKDDQGRYHTHRSTFSRLYQGVRHYIDDIERLKARETLEEQMKAKCDNTEDFQREMSIAIGAMIKSRECILLNQFHSEQQQPKYRMTDSDLRLLKKNINGYCSSSDQRTKQHNIEDLIDPANLLKSH